MEGESSDCTNSILDKFRELSKEGVEDHLESSKPSTENKSIGAVYLTNSSSNSFSSDDKRKRFSGRGGRYFQRDRGVKRKSDDFDPVSNVKSSRPQEAKPQGLHVGLKSHDVGITEFISNHVGFNGIIKQRFSDFQVNEISLDGKIIKLNNQDLPTLAPDAQITDEELNKALPKETWDKIHTIIDNKISDESVDVDITDLSKPERCLIHSCVKRLFKQTARSDTHDVNGRKVVKIAYCSNPSSLADRSFWKDKEYVQCAMYKKNLDTSVAANVLAHKLHMRANFINYSGTKDKRAITTQLICLKRVAAVRLNKIQPLRGIVLGNYEYTTAPLKLGDLNGNRFRIAVRNIDQEDDSVIAQAIESVKKKGVLNYFGMQRFGASLLVPTFAVGKALIHKDWKQAVELILKPRPGERCREDVSAARNIWWDTKDVKQAIRCLSYKNPSVELKLLEGLKKAGPNDYLNALGNIPRNMVMFYGHSYQSLIWNKVISRRVKEFGLTPIVGDIVSCGDKCAENEVPKKRSDDDSDTEENAISEEDEVQILSDRSNVRFLSDEDVKDAKIEDVLYPLPGYDVKYPNNATAEWYREFLKEDDISLESLQDLKRYPNVIPLYGAYRKMIEKPSDVTWSTTRYSEENADLLLNDEDEMNGVNPIETCIDGKYKALLLEFSLKPCTYATMVIREILKTETGSSFQAGLTAQHLADSANGSSLDKESAANDGATDASSTYNSKNKSDVETCDP